MNDEYLKESESKSLKWENLAIKLHQDLPRTRYLPENKDVKWILFPDDKFLDYWNILIAFLLLYTATVIPFRIALEPVDSTSFIVWDTIVDCLYFIDTVFNCVLAYYDSQGVLVTENKKILKSYIKGWFFIDLSSCIPIQLIIDSNGSFSKVIRIGSVPRLYRLIKMAKLIRMIKIIKARSQMLKYISKLYRVDAGVERLIWFLITFLVMIHILACLWIFIGEYYFDNTPFNWITESGLQDLDEFELYINGLYWCITTLSTVGYGDIHPYNTSERLYATCVMVIGIFIYSYIIGSLTNLLSSIDSRKAKLTKKLEILDNLTQEYGFNQAFYRKLTTALEYQHLNNKQELTDLLEDIPVNLSTQLLVLIYQKILESNAFFENKPSFFVAFVAPLLKPARYDVDEYIYHKNDYAKEMYFIVKGEVVMIAEAPTGEEVPFNILSKSYYFGETDILFSEGKERSFTVKSITKSELLSLDHMDFENMLKKFEDESLEIMTLAQQRNDRLSSKKEEALKNYLEKNEYKRFRSFPVIDVPKNTKFVDILDKSNSFNDVHEELYDEKPMSTRDEGVTTRFLLKNNEKTVIQDENEAISSNSLYRTVIEDKLLKEEDNLKIAKKKIASVEKTIQECLIVLKNITDFFNLEYQPEVLQFSSTEIYEENNN